MKKENENNKNKKEKNMRVMDAKSAAPKRRTMHASRIVFQRLRKNGGRCFGKPSPSE